MSPVLILGDSIRTASRHSYAQNVNGLDVVEPVDLADVIRSATEFDNLNGIELVRSILERISPLL